MASRLLATYTSDTGDIFRLVKVEDVRGTKFVAELQALDALGQPTWKEFFSINKKTDNRLSDKQSLVLGSLLEAMCPDTKTQGD